MYNVKENTPKFKKIAGRTYRLVDVQYTKAVATKSAGSLKAKYSYVRVFPAAVSGWYAIYVL